MLATSSAREREQMKRTCIILTSLLATLAACSDGPARLPDIAIDYGFLPDYGQVDTAVPDQVTSDLHPADIGRDAPVDSTTVLDVARDTGPCTLVCPATWLCGPKPCGDGECKPGCKAPKPICNLETRQCEPEVCVPDCAGKVCGYDGCGGKCGDNDGKCTGGLFCNYTSGQCEDNCHPDCAGKACGPDGCGKTCPPGCQNGVECHADGYCLAEGKCEASATELMCAAGDNSVSGETSWSIGTSTSALFNYSSECSPNYNPGREKAFLLKVPAGPGGLLEVDFSQSLPVLASFLSVFLIQDNGDGCLAANCVASGSKDSNLIYQVPASATETTYYLVADASVVNNGTFTITIKKCGWNGFDADAVEASDP